MHGRRQKEQGGEGPTPHWIFIHGTFYCVFKVEVGLLVLFLNLGFSIPPPLQILLPISCAFV